MKRREQPRLTSEDGIPIEFMVGRAVDVWADSDRPVSAMSRYSKAWEEYVHRVGIDRKEGSRLRPDATLYSVELLIAEGRRAEVDIRLARAGAVVADLPRLRARADEWVTAYRCRLGRP